MKWGILVYREVDSFTLRAAGLPALLALLPSRGSGLPLHDLHARQAVHIKWRERLDWLESATTSSALAFLV